MRVGERLPPLCPLSPLPKASRPAPAPFPRSARPLGPTAPQPLHRVPQFPALPPPRPALLGLPSPFPQADTARGWAPIRSRGSIPAASELSGAADCGRIRRHCLLRPHPQSSAARRLKNSSAQGTGSREPGAGNQEPRAESLTRERAAPRAPASFPGRRRFRPLRPTCGTAARDPTDRGRLYHVQGGVRFKCCL